MDSINKSEKKGLKGKAVCLVSGGLDSSTALYVALKEGYLPMALTVDYGQVHKREIESAKKIAANLHIDHHVITVELPWGGSSLTDRKIQIPESRSIKEMSSEIPNTYVPARNTIFLSLAASMAEAYGAEAIFIGVNSLDYSGYPDCRPEYMASIEQTILLGTKKGIEGKPFKIKVPLIGLTKTEIIVLAKSLGVPLELTWSCYKGGDQPCQVCDSCLLRKKGFEEAGISDPALSFSTPARY